MNIGPMSSTTEDSDWELTIIPRSRQPSSASQSSSLPKSQPAGTLQPILPKPNGPGQSVFPMTAPPNYRHPSSLNQVPYPQPHLQLVNQAPFPAPSFIAPVARPNPAVARIIQEGACKASNPLIQNPPTADVTVYGTPVTSQLPDPVQQRAVQQPAPAPVYVTPGYVAPPSKSVRGVRRGTTRGRGGRKPKIKVEAPDNGDTFTITSTPTGGRGSGRGRGRGGRVNRGGRPRGSRAGASSARGGKRKREDDDEKDDSDVSEIITVLPTQSRSGRKIIHANNFSPVVIDLEKEPPSSKTAATAKPASNAPIQPVKGKGGKRFSRPGEASVCKNCSRGHSPASNMIVFCDGCNGPWHQYCHDPPISSEVVRIEEQEWFCADCMVLREEKAHVDGKVSAETLSVVEKRRYLQSLPPAQLVSLLLHATVLHPDLPIFATPFGGPLPERPKRPITHFVDPTAPPEEEDESYDLYPDSEVLPYPKAGNGVPLPRESDFLSLLIDEDVGVYSHAWNWKQRGLDCDGNVEGGRINGTAIAA